MSVVAEFVQTREIGEPKNDKGAFFAHNTERDNCHKFSQPRYFKSLQK
jgi:hypothetical protein